jgi:hypothetical protein
LHRPFIECSLSLKLHWREIMFPNEVTALQLVVENSISRRQ